MYILFAVGALGLYCLMPRGEKSPALVGGLLGAAALIGLLVMFATTLLPAGGASFYFCLFSLIAIVAAVRVITHARPVYSALYFVLVVVAVAALLVLLEAEFLAAALIIVYAGAILITYVFVIMLAQQSGEPIYDRKAREPFLAIVAGFVLTAAIAGNVDRLSPTPPKPAAQVLLSADRQPASAMDGDQPEPGSTKKVDPRTRINELESRRLGAAEDVSLDKRREEELGPIVDAEDVRPVRAAAGAVSSGSIADVPGNTLLIGREVMTRFVVVLELSGVLLLIAMVGAIALSRKKMPSEVPAAVQEPLGEVGRHVKPF